METPLERLGRDYATIYRDSRGHACVGCTESTRTLVAFRAPTVLPLCAKCRGA